MRQSRAISITSVMSALAFTMSLLRLEISFYPLTYLKIDFAEIPSFITYYILGAKWALLCSSIHYLALLMRSGDPLGPTMKYLAVASTFMGFVLAKIWTNRTSIQLFMGMVTRVLTMDLANFIVLSIIFPYWLDFAASLLIAAGINAEKPLTALTYTMIITSIYNSIHVILSAVPAYIICRKVKRILGF